MTSIVLGSRVAGSCVWTSSLPPAPCFSLLPIHHTRSAHYLHVQQQQIVTRFCLTSILNLFFSDCRRRLINYLQLTAPFSTWFPPTNTTNSSPSPPPTPLLPMRVTACPFTLPAMPLPRTSSLAKRESTEPPILPTAAMLQSDRGSGLGVCVAHLAVPRRPRRRGLESACSSWPGWQYLGTPLLDWPVSSRDATWTIIRKCPNSLWPLDARK